MSNKVALSPWPSSSLRGNQINMYDLDIPHRQFSITPEGKYQDQWILTQSIQTNKSKINDGMFKNKTTK